MRGGSIPRLSTVLNASPRRLKCTNSTSTATSSGSPLESLPGAAATAAVEALGEDPAAAFTEAEASGLGSRSTPRSMTQEMTSSSVSMRCRLATGPVFCSEFLPELVLGAGRMSSSLSVEKCSPPSSSSLGKSDSPSHPIAVAAQSTASPFTAAPPYPFFDLPGFFSLVKATSANTFNSDEPVWLPPFFESD